jgi:hypothetical protein
LFWPLARFAELAGYVNKFQVAEETWA